MRIGALARLRVVATALDRSRLSQFCLEEFSDQSTTVVLTDWVHISFRCRWATPAD